MTMPARIRSSEIRFVELDRTKSAGERRPPVAFMEEGSWAIYYHLHSSSESDDFSSSRFTSIDSVECARLVRLADYRLD